MKKKRRHISLEEVLTEELKNPIFRFYFERERAVTVIAHLVREARRRAGLTQSELAEKARTSQTAIARLESGSDSRIPSLDLLERIAYATEGKLTISIEFKSAA